MQSFIHLRVKSSYSLLSSVLKVDNIVNLAAANNMPAVAMTDHNNLFGLLEFSLASKKRAIQPICGATVNVIYEYEHKHHIAEILLLAKNKIGFENLLRLVSQIYLANDRKIAEHITFTDLINYNEGLIMLSGYEAGIIGELLYKNDYAKAKYYAQYFQDVFGDRFYFEIMRHNLAKQQVIEAPYIKLSCELDIPLVASNNVLFPTINEHDKHDTLLCIAEGRLKTESNRHSSSNQCYFKSSKEMQALFHDIPSSISNSHYIAARCSVIAKSYPPLLPTFTDNKLSEESILRNESLQGLKIRLNNKFILNDIKDKEQQDNIGDNYSKRLQYELDIICNMGFEGYFLIVSDFIQWSKKQGISVGPGRGSVVGSIVAWCLMITDLDPMEFGLLFERFLNPERISMPDIDVDFCQERRDEVLSYVRSKYGESRVANIITFGSMQAKAVIKDVSRSMGLRFEIANYITDLVPFNAVHPVTLSQALEQVAELKSAYKGKGVFNSKFYDSDDAEQLNSLIKEVLDNALTLEGIQRHVSMHAAGIVISAEDLIKTVPLYKDNNSSNIVIQYSMKYAELVGLVKFDFLGLQTLTLIAKTCALLKHQNIHLDITNISLNDPKTFALLASGKTNGIFQFESFGMKDSIKKIKPDCIEDLIALGALYRPGPMDNIPTYIACKHKRQEPDYLHPLLEPILKETYGVIIYQEQVMEIAKVLGGYSLGSADLLRRAMGKKIQAEMKAQEDIFLQGAAKNNINAKQAEEIFNAVAKFAGYGFNKSHAAAYGLISYQTAYLKANYIAEFLVACLNLDINDQNKINVFVREAQENNIIVLLPDINKAKSLFSIEYTDAQKYIMCGFTAIKSVSEALGQYIHNESSKKPFSNIFDFIERIPGKLLNRRSLESLMLVGCFDAIHPNRNQLLNNVEFIIAHGSISANEKLANQFSLIPMDSTNQTLKDGFEDFSPTIKAEYEFDLLGAFISFHPITLYNDLLRQHKICNSDLLHKLPKGISHIKIAGVIQKKDSRLSDKGVFVSLQLSDNYGIFDLTIFSDKILQNYGHLLEVKKRLMISCEASKDDTSIRLTMFSAQDLEEAIMAMIKDNITIKVSSHEKLQTITQFLHAKKNNYGEKIDLDIIIAIDGSPFVAKIKISEKMNLSFEDLKTLQALGSISS